MNLLYRFYVSLVTLVIFFASPYILLSSIAKYQFKEDYLYLLPDYSVVSPFGEPDIKCYDNIYGLDSFRFFANAMNVYLGNIRPDPIPIHVAVYYDGGMYLWSFRQFEFVRLSEASLTYGNVYSCRDYQKST